MISSGMERVMARINTIEAKFLSKTANTNAVGSTAFADHLSAAMQSSQSSASSAVSSADQTQAQQLVRSAALRYGVKPELALAVAETESSFSQNAVSPVGAVGVMQLMPETAQSLGVRNINDIRENIDGGVRYLKQMLNLFQGDEHRAVAAYNAGPEAVKQYGGIPPYAETQNYVARVLNESRK